MDDVAGLSMVAGLLNYEPWYEAETVGQAQGDAALTVVTDFLTLPSTVLAILVVLRLTALQDDRIKADR
ncbi:hypothetical protein LUW77_15280 [Streptomyces radiopugnans]|nr:hypothetical protein LUW77_15280 [Streptomyces radiopugnans]